MLAAFISLWITLLICKYSKPSNIYFVYTLSKFSLIGYILYILSNDPPVINSKKILIFFLSLYVPKYFTIFLWFNVLNSSISY